MKLQNLLPVLLVSLMISGLAFAQEEQEQTTYNPQLGTARKATVVSAVAGTGTYLSLRKEYLYKSSLNRALTAKEITSIANGIKSSDKLIVSAVDLKKWKLNPARYKSITSNKSTKEAVKSFLNQIQKDGLMVKSVKRVNNVLVFDVIKRAKPLTLVMATTTVVSAGVAIKNFNAGKNSNSKERLNRYNVEIDDSDRGIFEEEDVYAEEINTFDLEGSEQ